MRVPIVALGASAGGLDALFEFFSALPPSTAAAYVVIQHLDREHKSLLADLLGKRTSMPVAEIGKGMRAQPDHVYVIPPNTSLTLVEEQFRLAPRDASSAPHHPFDVFLASLARSHLGAAIAVVFSGGDSDGAHGVKVIKDEGGITFAQDPESTKFPGMPQSAIETGCIDFVMRPSEIAHEIARLCSHPYLLEGIEAKAAEGAEPAPDAEDEERSLKRIFRRLRSAHGVDFTHYKRATLRRRLARRMALNKIDDLKDYVDGIEDDAVETAALYHDFLIRVTGFFRDPELFEGLRQHVFPVVCEQRTSKDPIRMWVAGCATGEEVYSIAIALLEYLGDQPAPRIQIFGTDLSEAAIDLARAGVFLENIAEDVSKERLQRFFVKENGRYHVAKRVRELCVFARHDVTRDPPFSRIELVSCRNLLIYLDVAAQRRVMRAFHYALTPQGFLALGLAESVGAADDMFELVEKRNRIYSRRSAPAEMLPDAVDRGNARYGRSQSPAIDDLVEYADADSLHREADRELLGRYSPPSLLIDDSMNILQFRGETGRYLEHASGPPSMNLQRVVRPELLVELSPAIQEARQGGAAVWRQGLRIDDISDVSLGVIPLRPASPERSFLIVFDADGGGARRARPVPTQNLTESEKDRRLAQLERELVSTREYLQVTMEQQEAVREELKSAHEEVLSANEEFQSTNEELETAKEELQSTNEELTTTNDELLNRNRELSALNIELQRTRENALRARSYADAIVTSVRDPLVVLDRELRVLRANDAYYAEFETSRDRIEGKLLRELGEQPWDDGVLLEKLGEVLTKDVVLVDYEVRYHAKPRQLQRILRVDATRIPGDVEREELVLLAIEDVTERRSHAEMLEVANQRKDEFLAMLAHELRKPLTPIAHAVHLLKRNGDGTTAPVLHEMIGRQTRRLVRLVDDLLDLARINRGHIELRREPMDLVTVVRNATDAAQTRMEGRGHQLAVSLPDSPVVVFGDAVRLEQIVSNLLENGAKYTEPGGRIEVRLTQSDGRAVLSVRDNGIGIAAEDLERVFDLFNQVDKSLARSGGGLGIGLTLVRRVLALHDGTIEARSAGLGHGSEFIVRLPISAEERVMTSDAAGRQDTDAPLQPSSRRVLIVDDNADAVESMQMLAEHWGHDVSIASNGPEAIKVAQAFHPHAALVDIGLPGMDGYELARRLRAKDGGLFLIAMTGYGRTEDRDAAMMAGFDAHLVKPANLDELQDLLAHGR